MKIAIFCILLIGVNSQALDCAQFATSLSTKSKAHGSDYNGGPGMSANLGEMNVLVQLYHDACGPIPKNQALQLAETLMSRRNSIK